MAKTIFFSDFPFFLISYSYFQLLFIIVYLLKKTMNSSFVPVTLFKLYICEYMVISGVYLQPLM